MRWFQALMPREDRFFELYIRHAETLVAGAQALRAVLQGGPETEAAVARVFALEDQADGIARDVLLLVQKSFITPFDRGDIKQLINTLDDAIDQMKKAAKAIQIFEVKSLEPEMAAMGEIIEQAAMQTLEAVKKLHAMRENAKALHAITEKIIRLEEDADTLNDKSIKSLFLRHRDGNAMNYIVSVEVFDHLEKVMDRFEDVANRISSLVIEQV
jgi:predicted phosphate transport protein (TIGR00153 family)